MAQNKNWLAIIAVIAIAAVVLIFSQGNLSGAATTSFGTSGVSARELPKGICVVEVDEVIVEESTEALALVITETGRKPAFGKVQSLWIYGDDENGGGLREGQWVEWSGTVVTAARSLTGIPTGVPFKVAEFVDVEPGNEVTIIGQSEPSAVDFVSTVLKSNGIPIASQGRAGEIIIGLEAYNGDAQEPQDPFEEQSAFNLHVIAVIESPVGNLCSMNLVPVGNLEDLNEPSGGGGGLPT